jgi:hypothetical protein
MKKSSWSVAAYLIAVFASGVLVGAVGHRLYSTNPVIATTATEHQPTRPEDYRKKYVSEMQTRLKLSASQLEQLNGILDITRERFRELRERTRPEMKQIQQEQVEKIQIILNSDQQKEYAKMREEREREREKERERQRREASPNR